MTVLKVLFTCGRRSPYQFQNFLMCAFYRPQTKFAKVMFLHVSVILSTGGMSAPLQCWNTPPRPEAGTSTPPPSTRGRYAPAPEAGTSWTRGRYPPVQCMLGDMGNKRVVRILLECNLFSHIFSHELKIKMCKICTVFTFFRNVQCYILEFYSLNYRLKMEMLKISKCHICTDFGAK